MPNKVELYDGEYGNYESDVYRHVRIETYGVDFGQTSWVGGMISQEEIATRSRSEFYLFSPLGENERLIQQAGFTDLSVLDTTEHAARTAARWHQARQKYKERLI